MAINLKKENYPDSSIPTVYPESGEVEEIYPQREIYPSTPAADPSPIPRRMETPAEAAPLATAEPNNITLAEKQHRQLGKALLAVALIGAVLIAAALTVVIGTSIIATDSDPEPEVATTVVLQEEPIQVPDEDPYSATRSVDYPLSEVSEINISDSFSEVYLSYAYEENSRYISISVDESNDREYSITQKDGELSISRNKTGQPDLTKGFVTVYVPQNYKGDISVNTDNSYVSCGVSGNNIDIITTGDIFVENVDSERLSVFSGSGDISINASSCGDFMANTGNGDIIISDGIFDSTNIHTANGDINIYTTISHGGADISSGNGGFYGENISVGGVSSIETVNGDAYIYNIDFKDMSFDITNAEAQVHASGDRDLYSVATDISGGETDVKESLGGDFQLNITTQNGDAYFEFGCDSPVVPEKIEVEGRG